MIFLDTYWTPGYLFILGFVFTTLYLIARKWLLTYHTGLVKFVWAAWGTFFFHCWW